jgi:DNA repair protein RecN (Recombination protein N)
VLRKLTVQNFAIIRSLEVNLKEGFTVITGETGAGKSILMGALGLVTGSRADTSVLLDREQKCVVEAEFSVSEELHGQFFAHEDIDFQQPCLIRREINPAGKSRSFINDTPVSLQQLKSLSALLIDIHSQHQTLEIKESEKRFEYLDAFAANRECLNTYRKHYAEYERLMRLLKDTEEAIARDAREIDFLRFQLNELEAFRPIAGEYEQLKEQHEILSNAEDTAGALSEALFILEDSESSLRLQMARVRNLMPKIARLGQSGKALQERIYAAETELKDIVAELQDLTESTSPDPQRLEELSARLAGYEQLFRKHNCQSDVELMEISASLNERCSQFSDKDSRLEGIRQSLQLVEQSMLAEGRKLSESRKKAALVFAEKVTDMLGALEMKHARLEWQVMASTKAHAQGLDEVEILFSANAGQALQPLSKTASGGELSRVMLVIKTIVAGVSALPAIIFDEIDTGVSGKVAASMGNMMRSMGRTMQVIAITHLPQVAAHGHDHFEVFKETAKGQTSTGLRHLEGDQRLHAIAHMISHEKVSDAALKHAEDLLKSGNLA